MKYIGRGGGKKKIGREFWARIEKEDSSGEGDNF